MTDEDRAALGAIIHRGGLLDAYRHLHDGPDDVHYTWWNYRQGHFHRKMGLRIDYVLLSDPPAAWLAACHIEREFRKGTKPSDHAPLVAEF